jgi:C4-dicarboxylate-specific signal transduction histidine kinase
MGIIAALLVEHRRRRRAEVESRQHLVAMAHLDRRAAMGELATSLAHEINQPLNAILHNADAARMIVDGNGHAPPGELGEILDDIRKDDLRAAEIIKRMRSLLKKHELERQPVDMKDLALDTIHLIGADAGSRGITLDFDLKDGLPPAMGDRVHLQQVLLNLMMNGMDALASTPADRRRLFIRCVEQAGRVGLLVRDLGPGIPQDRIDQIFEPFFTTKGEGMGMGLAIARSIIEAHDGRIAAENNTNGGATVWFSVPSAGGPAAGVT